MSKILSRSHHLNLADKEKVAIEFEMHRELFSELCTRFSHLHPALTGKVNRCAVPLSCARLIWLQWRQMSVDTSQFTWRWCVCYTLLRLTSTKHHSSKVFLPTGGRWIPLTTGHLSPMDSLHKGPVMQKAFLCLDVIIWACQFAHSLNTCINSMHLIKCKLVSTKRVLLIISYVYRSFLFIDDQWYS